MEESVCQPFVLGVLSKMTLKFQFEEPFLRETGSGVVHGLSAFSMHGETPALQNQQHKGKHCTSNLFWGFHLNWWLTSMWWRTLCRDLLSQFWGLGLSQVSQKAGEWLWSARRGSCPMASAVLHTMMDTLPMERVVAIWRALRNCLQGKRL